MREDAHRAPRPLTGGAVMSGASRTVVAVTGAAATIMVARLLGPAGAGGFAIAQTLMLVLMVGVTLGLEHGIVYYVSRGHWSARRANRSAQRMAAISGLAGAAAGVAGRLLIPSAFGGLSLASVMVVAGALPFALSWLYFSYVALAGDRYEGFALPPVLQSALALILIAALGAIFGLSGAVAGFALAHLLTALAAAIAARRALPASARVPDAPPATGALRRAISFGIKGYSANALQLINYRLDLFILSSVAGAAAVGHYAVAVAVTGVLWLMPQALSDVVFARVASLSSATGEQSARSLEFVEAKSLRHAVTVVVLGAAVLAGALLLLVVPIYGAAFRPAITLGLILLPGVALLGVANTMAATIVGRGHPGYLLATTLVTMPLTVALYLVLIPDLHATGAAIASSISYTCSFVLTAVAYRRVVGRSLSMRLVPTRSELEDYLALPPAIRRWIADLSLFAR